MYWMMDHQGRYERHCIVKQECYPSIYMQSKAHRVITTGHTVSYLNFKQIHTISHVHHTIHRQAHNTNVYKYNYINKWPTILHFHAISICVMCSSLALWHLDTLATTSHSPHADFGKKDSLLISSFLVQTLITMHPSLMRMIILKICR